MMRRTSPIMLTVAAVGLMPLMCASSQKQVDSRTPVRSATIKRVQVNARTITALPSAKKYVVDLTQRGVVYEFDSKTNRIDFSRVMVRTARGEVTISSYLERVLRPGKLPSPYRPDYFEQGATYDQKPHWLLSAQNANQTATLMFVTPASPPTAPIRAPLFGLLPTV